MQHGLASASSMNASPIWQPLACTMLSLSPRTPHHAHEGTHTKAPPPLTHTHTAEQVETAAWTQALPLHSPAKQRPQLASPPPACSCLTAHQHAHGLLPAQPAQNCVAQTLCRATRTQPVRATHTPRASSGMRVSKQATPRSQPVQRRAALQMHSCMCGMPRRAARARSLDRPRTSSNNTPPPSIHIPSAGAFGCAMRKRQMAMRRPALFPSWTAATPPPRPAPTPVFPSGSMPPRLNAPKAQCPQGSMAPRLNAPRHTALDTKRASLKRQA
eukprot:354321-Chlamydomonas_euryale.AAC.4